MENLNFETQKAELFENMKTIYAKAQATNNELEKDNLREEYNKVWKEHNVLVKKELGVTDEELKYYLDIVKQEYDDLHSKPQH